MIITNINNHYIHVKQKKTGGARGFCPVVVREFNSRTEPISTVQLSKNKGLFRHSALAAEDFPAVGAFDHDAGFDHPDVGFISGGINGCALQRAGIGGK